MPNSPSRTPRSSAIIAALSLTLSLALTFAASLHAIEPPSTADFAWLAGDWHGVMGESVIEEIWSAPASGTLLGMFRWSTKEGVRLYELMSIEDTETGPILYLRHFSPGLQGWEEKDAPMVYKLDAYADKRVSFISTTDQQTTRLTYQSAASGLEIILDQIRGAEKSTMTFVFERR